MAAFRTLLFDLDGTLIDHFAAIHRAHAHTRQAFGLPAPTPAQVRAAVGGGLESALRRFVSEDQLPRAAGIFREYWNRTLLDDVVLLPGARELLAALQARGARLAVLTNKLGSSARQICRHLGIAESFAAIVGSEDTPWLKPRPELIAHVLAQLGAPPDGSDALLVGDSPYDIQAAHGARLPAWCVATGTHAAVELGAAGADRVFADLAQLQAALV